MGTRTGQYSGKIIDVCTKKNTTHPPINQFHEFFSQFGTIFTVYHHDNSHKPRKPDHTYVVFEKESAVKSVKKHWAQMDKSNYWKKSCNIGSCIMSCPAAMMNHIKSITGGTSGPATKSQADQNASGSGSNPASVKEEPARTPQLPSLKRNRGDQSGAADLTSEPNKRIKTAIKDTGPSANQTTVPSHTYPLRSRATVNENRETTPPIPSTQQGRLGVGQPPTHPDGGPSTLVSELAEASNLLNNAPSINTTTSELQREAEKLRSEFEQMRAKRDMVKSECDRLLVERDEARTEAQKYRVEQDEARVEIEGYRAERDKAIEQCEAESDTCRELRKRIEGLENALKDKVEHSRQVLKLVIASLQTGSVPDLDQSGASFEAQS